MSSATSRAFRKLEIDGEILPNDQKDPEDGVRGALRIKQAGHLGSRWSTSIDYASVSDDQYLEDFGNRLDVTSVRNLSQRADLNYTGDGWRMLGRFQQFQTVDTSIAPANRPYGQLPHIELDVDPKTWNQGVEYDFDGQYDYFDHNSAVHGSRLVAIPSLRLPLRRGFGYLIPRARLYYTAYDLVDETEGCADAALACDPEPGRGWQTHLRARNQLVQATARCKPWSLGFIMSSPPTRIRRTIHASTPRRLTSASRACSDPIVSRAMTASATRTVSPWG